VTESNAAVAAGDGEELRRQGGPHAGQAADEGRVRVAGQSLFDLPAGRGEPFFGLQGLGGRVADQPGGHSLAGHADLLGCAAATAASASAVRCASLTCRSLRRCASTRARPAARISPGVT